MGEEEEVEALLAVEKEVEADGLGVAVVEAVLLSVGVGVVLE